MLEEFLLILPSILFLLLKSLLWTCTACFKCFTRFESHSGWVGKMAPSGNGNMREGEMALTRAKLKSKNFREKQTYIEWTGLEDRICEISSFWPPKVLSKLWTPCKLQWAVLFITTCSSTQGWYSSNQQKWVSSLKPTMAAFSRILTSSQLLVSLWKEVFFGLSCGIKDWCSLKSFTKHPSGSLCFSYRLWHLRLYVQYFINLDEEWIIICIFKDMMGAVEICILQVMNPEEAWQRGCKLVRFLVRLALTKHGWSNNARQFGTLWQLSLHLRWVLERGSWTTQAPPLCNWPPLIFDVWGASGHWGLHGIIWY